MIVDGNKNAKLKFFWKLLLILLLLYLKHANSKKKDQQLILKKNSAVLRLNLKSLLSRIYTGDFFACDFLIQMDVAKLHIFDCGSHCDKSNVTAENDCRKLFAFQ